MLINFFDVGPLKTFSVALECFAKELSWFLLTILWFQFGWFIFKFHFWKSFRGSFSVFLYLFFQFQTTSKIFFDSKSILLNCWDFKGQKGLFLDNFMHFKSFCMHFQCWTNKTGGKLGLFLSPALKTGKNSSQGLIILGKRDSSTLTWSVVFTTLVWRGGQEQLKIAGQASEGRFGQSWRQYKRKFRREVSMGKLP